MRVLKLCVLALAAFSAAPLTGWAQEQTLRIAVLQYGTVNWELDTIAHYDLDSGNGFEMEVQGVAGGSAAQVAFQGGTADAIVSDWIWVARQRAAGNDYVFLPYSKAVGGLMVPSGSSVATLKDLVGKKIGIAGGPLDKSWILFRAYAEAEYGVDIAAETEQVFGAPPLIFKSALDGEVAGAINFWHFMAKMKAAGMTEILSVADASMALGLDPESPLLGYVFKGELLREQPELIAQFARASRAAKDLLATDEAAWARLRPLMKPENDAEFEYLKAGFREGIPAAGPVDQASAEALLALMARLGGAELVGEATRLPDGLFIDPLD